MATLTIAPAGAALDTPLRIMASGFASGTIASLSTLQLDQSGRPWSASASFVADEQGDIDTTSDAPLAGSYAGVDAMGLVWSMTREADQADRGSQQVESGRAPPLAPALLQVAVRVGDGTPIEAMIERARRPREVARQATSAEGLLGVLFHPDDGGPYPGILLLGGSEGGLQESDAALLAAHGFSVLALGYFGMEGVPSSAVDLPLEVFGSALEWLLAHPSVVGDRVGVLGASKGGEAALLTGAMFPGVGAVVSVAGSGVVTAGVPRGLGLLDVLRADAASWTWRGRPMPHLPYVVGRDLIDQVESGEPVELRRAFRPDLTGRPDLTAVTIPVEHIRGPVLLLSADDDAYWPSGDLSDIAMLRLDRHGHRYPHQHVRYPGAGHLITRPPYGPTEQFGPGPGVTLSMGGSIAGTSAARADAWQRTIEWFAEHLPA